MARDSSVRAPRRGLVSALGALPLAIACGAVRAQGAYPSRPVKLVVPAGPGSGSDILARQLAGKLADAFPQGVFVENRTGGNATIGHDYAKNAAPDGYTLLVSSTAPMLVLPALSTSAKHRLSDFVSVAALARSAFLVLVAAQPDAPGTLKELAERIRAKPSNFGSSGTGAMTHLVSELFLQRAGVQATHVPYKGSGQVLADLAGGHVLFASDSPGAALSLIRSGRLRALAVSTRQRIATLPDVPTFAESGFGEADVSVISGVFAPAGTPREIVERLNIEIEKALDSPEFQARLAAQDLERLKMSAERFHAQLASEAPFWQQFAQRLGLKFD